MTVVYVDFTVPAVGPEAPKIFHHFRRQCIHQRRARRRAWRRQFPARETGVRLRVVK